MARNPRITQGDLLAAIHATPRVAAAANNEQAIPPQEDEAIAMVAADPTFDGLVFADPPLYVPLCSDFIANAPQYTDAGATDIAQVYGAHYAAHP